MSKNNWLVSSQGLVLFKRLIIIIINLELYRQIHKYDALYC